MFKFIQYVSTIAEYFFLKLQWNKDSVKNVVWDNTNL